MHGVIIFGKPCSGKSTISKEFATLYGYEYISSGDVARKMADDNPGVGALLAAGRMAPEVMMRTMIRNMIGKCVNNNKNFILDGFPRFRYQEDYLYEMFPELAFIRVHISVDDNVARDRAKKRARMDDDIEAFETRLNYYHNNTEELISSCSITIYNDDGMEAYEAADKLYLEVCECLR